MSQQLIECLLPAQTGRWSVAEADGSDELSLADAAALYDVSLVALRRRVSLGEIAAYKVNGVRGREWRVSASVLQQAGYAPRAIELRESEAEGPQMEVRRLTEALVAERARSKRLDSELGYALLTIGRLRGQLREAGIDPDELFGAEIGCHDCGNDSPERR